jgi:hypothetical protein
MDTDRLIDRLFPKVERACARSIRDECLSGLREDQQIAALHELAAPTTLSPEQSARYFTSFLDNIGAEISGQRFAGWVDQGGPGEWWNSEPAPAAPHDALIASLWESEASRETARQFVERWNVPGMEDRIEGLLRRGAENDRKVTAGDMTEQEARDDFARLVQEGAPSGVEDEFGEWFATEGDPRDAGETYDITPVTTGAVTAMIRGLQSPSPSPPPSAPPAPAGPTRAELQAQIAQHEANMRAPQGSEPWRDYWTRGGGAACLDARRALESADTTQVTGETDGQD